MITDYRIVSDVADQIESAIDLSVDALSEGRVEHEPAMTDRMLGSIETSLSGYRSSGVRWTAKTLTDRGKGSQERHAGADFLVVIDINLPDFKITKGFLAQAKLLRPGRSIDHDDLKHQCEKMLTISRDSYVFLYDKSGVNVVPATSVCASNSSLRKLYKRTAKRFFMDHLECFVGDPKISSPTPEGIQGLIDIHKVRLGQIISARKDDPIKRVRRRRVIDLS